jgi:hypothetical protein
MTLRQAVRSGSWLDPAVGNRCASLHSYYPALQDSLVGFRPVVEEQPAEVTGEDIARLLLSALRDVRAVETLVARASPDLRGRVYGEVAIAIGALAKAKYAAQGEAKTAAEGRNTL